MITHTVSGKIQFFNTKKGESKIKTTGKSKDFVKYNEIEIQKKKNLQQQNELCLCDK